MKTKEKYNLLTKLLNSPSCSVRFRENRNKSFYFKVQGCTKQFLYVLDKNGNYHYGKKIYNIIKNNKRGKDLLKKALTNGAYFVFNYKFEVYYDPSQEIKYPKRNFKY